MILRFYECMILALMIGNRGSLNEGGYKIFA